MVYSTPLKPTVVIQPMYKQLWTSGIHMLPLFFAAFFIYLSYASTFWFPPSGVHTSYYSSSANGILNSLQLAAKVYELLVVASLGAITLKAYKRAFIGSGVPFGMLSGPYRVGDLNYLCSPYFRRPLFRRKLGKATILALLLSLVTFLSVLVGPATAILIVPELNWFRLPKAFSKVLLPVVYTYEDRANGTIWSTVMKENDWRNENHSLSPCRVYLGNYRYYCPAAGLPDIYTWASGWAYSGLPDNITFQDPSGTLIRRLDMQSDDRNGTFITTPSALTSKTLGQLMSYIRVNDVGTIHKTEQWKLKMKQSSVDYQPLVQAKCEIWNKPKGQNLTSNLKLSPSKLTCFSGKSEGDCNQIRDQISDWILPSDIAKRDDNMIYGFSTTNADIQDDAKTSDPSTLLFSASLPYFYDGELQGLRVLGCSYIAHWIPSTAEINPTFTNYITTNITDFDVFSKYSDGVAVGPLINIDRSWLPSFDLSTNPYAFLEIEKENARAFQLKNVTSTYSFGALLNTMVMSATIKGQQVQYFGPTGRFLSSRGKYDETAADDKVKKIIERLTGSFLADAIARSAAYSTAYYVSAGNHGDDSVVYDPLSTQEGPMVFELELFKNGTTYIPQLNTFSNTSNTWDTIDDFVARLRNTTATLEFDAEQYGYGFGQFGLPSKFAMGVIISYILILLMYFCHAVCSGAETVSPWGDLQDLIALALSSPAPSQLEKQGVQVVDKDLWKEGLSINSTDENIAQMVLGNDNTGMKRLERDKPYY